MAISSTLQKISQGNKHFQASTELGSLQKLASEGQKPAAIVVACADSRVAPEIIFGSKLGEIFVIRVAGNVVGPHELASIEYAALVLEVPLCIVIGHSNCGAVGEAVRCFEEKASSATPSLQSLVNTIMPAVEKTAEISDVSDKAGFLSAAISANARHVCAELTSSSEALAKKVKEGSFTVKSAVFDMTSGQFEVLDI